MAKYKDQATLEKTIYKLTEKAVQQTQNQVYAILQDYIQNYYGEYQPEEYNRTLQFLKSLVKTKVNLSGNHVSCAVYIDTDNMNYKYHNAEDVVDMIGRGYHADTGMKTKGYSPPYAIQGTKVFSRATEEIVSLNPLVTFLKDLFASQGIDMKIISSKSGFDEDELYDF